MDEAAAEREVVALGHLSALGKGEVNEVRPFRPDDEVGGLYVAVRPALGVEFGQRLDAPQCHADVRFDRRAWSATRLPQLVQVRPFVPRLEVPGSVFPFAVREVDQAEAQQNGPSRAGARAVQGWADHSAVASTG